MDQIPERRQSTQAQAVQLIAASRNFSPEGCRTLGGFHAALLACDGCIDASGFVPTGGAIAGPATLPDHSNYITRS